MKQRLAILCATLIAATASTAPAQWGARVVDAHPGTPHSGDAVRSVTSDPTGDTFGMRTPQHDITSFSAAVQGADLAGAGEC